MGSTRPPVLSLEVTGILANSCSLWRVPISLKPCDELAGVFPVKKSGFGSDCTYIHMFPTADWRDGRSGVKAAPSSECSPAGLSQGSIRRGDLPNRIGPISRVIWAISELPPNSPSGKQSSRVGSPEPRCHLFFSLVTRRGIADIGGWWCPDWVMYFAPSPTARQLL